ncbi:MAG: hypothetical protein V7640_2649, partial [Betaproteobacteria bacterium]
SSFHAFSFPFVSFVVRLFSVFCSHRQSHSRRPTTAARSVGRTRCYRPYSWATPFGSRCLRPPIFQHPRVGASNIGRRLSAWRGRPPRLKPHQRAAQSTRRSGYMQHSRSRCRCSRRCHPRSHDRYAALYRKPQERIAAATDFLRGKGHDKVAIVSHSMGRE